MRQFLEGSDEAFANLAERAKRQCVVFPDEEMPEGTQPHTARVGFEVDSSGGEARLLVDRGLRYRGSVPSVATWLRDGQMRFADVTALRQWIRTALALGYGARDGNPLSRAHSVPPSVLESAREVAVPKQTRLNPDDLFSAISQSVRGQDGAIRSLAQRVSNHLARIAPRRPLTLLAVGPTGVGKTKTAEALADSLMSTRAIQQYLRLDMTEYQERHRVSQLVGAPPGYVGYGDGAALVDTLSASPRTLVLFDEIEKAHAEVIRTLMNAMDAGRLASPSQRGSSAREIDCRQAIFLFTSNIGGDQIMRGGPESEPYNEQALEELCRSQLGLAGFPPDLIGRLRGFLVFRPLPSRVRAEILAIAIGAVAGEYGLRIGHIAPAVFAHFLNKDPDNRFGVRPLEYLVDDELGDCFASWRSVDALAALDGPPWRCSAHPICADSSPPDAGEQ